MRIHNRIMLFTLLAGAIVPRLASAAEPAVGQPAGSAGKIPAIDPPERDFFSKRLDYEGIRIEAHKDVSDEALFEARARLAMMLDKLPEVRQRLQEAGAKLHIIGRSQVTSDLPENRHLKGKPFAGKLTVDQRTRGLGGLLTSWFPRT